MDLAVKFFAIFGFLMLLCILGANFFNDDNIDEMDE
jgi:hypothetical protein